MADAAWSDTPVPDLGTSAMAVLEHLNDAVVVTDADLDPPGPRIVYANRAFCAATGYPLDQLLGRSPRLLQGPRTRRAELDRLRAALREGQPVRAELVNYRADGTTFVVELDISPVRDADGVLHRFVAVQRDVSDRRREERRSAALVQHASDLLSVSDAAGRVSYVSPSITHHLGWCPEDVLGRPGFDLVHPDDRERVADGFAQKTDIPGTHRPVVFRFLAADGTYRWVEAISTNLLDDEAVAGIVVNARDITERKAAEARLADSEARLRLAIGAARLGLFELDTGRGRVEWDEVGAALWGYAGQTGADVAAVLEAVREPDDRRGMREALDTALAGGLYECEFRVSCPRGGARWLMARGQMDPERPGVLRGVLADVTEQRAAAAELGETLDALGDAYLAVGPDRHVRWVNQRAAALLGVERGGVEGSPLAQVLPPGAALPVEAAVARAVSDQAPVSIEAWVGPWRAWYEVRAHPTHAGAAVYLHDVSERRAAELEREHLLAEAEKARARLVHQATHDHLTGLGNRAHLRDHLHRQLGLGLPIGVLFFDLDRFKVVNDSLGHAGGDELLVEVGGRLAAWSRRTDLVTRLGGDEFVVCTPSDDVAELAKLADRLLHAVRAPIRVGGLDLVVTASVGIAVAGPGATPETILRDADTALYAAKDAGRDRAVPFDEHLREQVTARLELEADLRRAVDHGDVVLHYQPQFDLRTGECRSVEALARWPHPRHGLISPARFMPVAEETDLVVPLGACLLDRAASQAAAWADEGRDWRVWVNVSVRQLIRPDFAERVAATLARHDALGGRVGIEVTESALAADPAAAARQLHRLSDQGVPVALDDFGTGYSSLDFLRRWPLQVLKVDRSFVADLDGSERTRAVVRAMVELGHALGAVVSAEGVETEAQLDEVRALGCDTVCGYLLARPAPADELGPVVSPTATMNPARVPT